jgi:hypothetical protein
LDCQGIGRISDLDNPGHSPLNRVGLREFRGVVGAARLIHDAIPGLETDAGQEQQIIWARVYGSLIARRPQKGNRRSLCHDANETKRHHRECCHAIERH